MAKKQSRAATAIADIPGVGLLTATALAAAMGDPTAFESGREFAAFLGLVPRQSGTGGQVSPGHISKQGDLYLCRLLIHGAGSVLVNVRDKGVWAEALMNR